MKGKNEVQLLVVNSHINFAWGFDFHGSAIFSDGSIYTWDSNKNSNGVVRFDLGDVEVLKEYIKSNGTKEENRVPEEDLDEIKEIISKLTKKETEFTSEHRAYDMGGGSISVYKDDVEIELRKSGDYVGSGAGRNVSKLISLTKRHLGG